MDSIQSDICLKSSFRKKVILFSIFFSVKVLAIQPGEIFWEAVKPGESTANYLIGTMHRAVLDENSFPPELVAAIENAKVGLFEIMYSDQTEKYVTEARKKTMWLPEGESLSLYIDEDRVQRLFSALQVALSELDEDEVFFLHNEWKEFDLDITSYEDFNNLRPSEVLSIIDLVLDSKSDLRPQPLMDKDERKKVSRYHSKSDMEECLSQRGGMDSYIEKVLSCLKKPVYSLETLESRRMALSALNNADMVEELIRDFDKLILRLTGSPQEEEDDLHKEWRSFLSEIKSRLYDHIASGYLNKPVDNTVLKSDFAKAISEFLVKKKCPVSASASINQYAKGIVDNYQLKLKVQVKGKQMEETEEEQLRGLINGTNYREKEVFSLCFPDYKWPEDLEESLKRKNKLQLDRIKNMIKLLSLLRDPKLVQNMLPYFEKGGAFVVFGLAHLSGVLKGLKMQGYEIRQVKFSTPLKTRPLSPVYDKELIETWGEVRFYKPEEPVYEDSATE